MMSKLNYIRNHDLSLSLTTLPLPSADIAERIEGRKTFKNIVFGLNQHFAELSNIGVLVW